MGASGTLALGLTLLLLALAGRAPASALRFTYLDYATIHSRLAVLAAAHPNLLHLDSAQARYGLPSVGECSELVSGAAVPKPCLTWIATLTNRTSLPDDLARPQAIVSGEVHGNEIVGPHAVLAYIERVLASVAAPPGADPHGPYLARMLNTRVVTLLPMTNAVGFHRRERGERQAPSPANSIDPNRDFAFDQVSAQCMVTVAARAINELFRENLFRVLVTFHGGTNVIGYEWGDMQHCADQVCQPAPDASGMAALARRMSDYAGPAGVFEGKYPTGTMGKLVYPVHGGMEDWAYGASWARQSVKCKPPTLGGYPEERTTYTNATHRCVTYLVETSSEKAPAQESLGDDTDVLTAGAVGDGHIPRNVRVIASVVDALEPYVAIVRTASTRAVGENATTTIGVTWRIGGAFNVDGTYLQWSDGLGAVHGSSNIWNGSAGVPMITGGASKPTLFVASVPATALSGSPLYLRVAAVVDTTMSGALGKPNVESHLFGARGSSKWAYAEGKARIAGHDVFYSETRRANCDPETKVVYFSVVTNATWGPSGNLAAPSDSETARSLRHGVSEVVPQPKVDPTANADTNSSDLHASADDGSEVNLNDSAGGVNQTNADAAKGKHGYTALGSMDPRDRNAMISGVIGILLLTGVTATISLKMWRHHLSLSREVDDAAMNNLKEPLRSGAADDDSLDEGNYSQGSSEGAPSAATSTSVDV
jgi:Zinc carboxypeptidase